MKDESKNVLIIIHANDHASNAKPIVMSVSMHFQKNISSAFNANHSEEKTFRAFIRKKCNDKQKTHSKRYPTHLQ